MFLSLISYEKTSFPIVYCVETTSNTNISSIKKILDAEDYLHNSLKNSIVFVGPKLGMTSPWCSNMIQILNNSGINNVIQIEKYICSDKHNLIDFDDMTEQVYKKLPNTFNTSIIREKTKKFNYEDIEKINHDMKLNLDAKDINLYKAYFKKRNIQLTDIELFDLAQSNSEHSRHWIFNGKFCIDDNYKSETLMELVKKPLKNQSSNSIIAFKDNSSAIRGFQSLLFNPIHMSEPAKCLLHPVEIDFTLTAETHNFPTGIAPFQGATTGIGGRIRDNIAIGRGGNIVAGTAGYCVGEIDITNKNKAYKILTEASDGASDYGNKIGEPIILGFARTFKQIIHGQLFEWDKPIMFTAGIGTVLHKNINKHKPINNNIITRIGGPAYRIGVGGGSASSDSNNENNNNISAVQRGDPGMENKVVRAIRNISSAEGKNIILSIHDQGAGGMANVTKEIVSPVGGEVFLNKVNIGDKSLSSLEIWGAEYQEQVTILIDEKNRDIVKSVCTRENVPVEFVGSVKETGKIEVFDRDNTLIVNLDLDETLNKIPQKEYTFKTVKHEFFKLEIPEHNFIVHIKNIFSLISVSSKRHLTNKVDRSVSGLIAQQQCIGPLQTPLSNYAIIATTHHNLTGCATSIGEQPIKSLINSSNMVNMTVGEMLTNIIFAKITCLKDIKCSGNWMWSPKLEGEGSELYSAVKTLSDIFIQLGIAIDGGKDSMSMHSEINGKIIKTPRTLVLSAYAPMVDIRKKITPELKKIGSDIIFVDLGYNYARLGGSSIAQYYDQLGNESPDFENINDFAGVFKIIQKYIESDKLLAGHDRSDGGLITCLTEMVISSNIGCRIDVISQHSEIDYWFNEELGLIVEIDKQFTNEFLAEFKTLVPVYKLGETCNGYKIEITHNSKQILSESITELRYAWEKTNYKIELNKIPKELAFSEMNELTTINRFNYVIPESIYAISNFKLQNSMIQPIKVGVIREEGSNGDREMAAALHSAGFEVWDINMNDLIKNPYLLYSFRGIVFVGGFSYSDVLGAANGWYNVIQNNETINKQFRYFFNRKNTFSLGVCNGCQLMARLGLFEGIETIEQNTSKRFESRFSQVKIPHTNSIMLSELEGLSLGIWVAHGEGRFNPNNCFDKSTICMQYVDPMNIATEIYPYNPNGSSMGIAGICSENGRHLAMMPHPERCFLNWQMAWKPYDLKNKHIYSPWFYMFKNAFIWCNNNI